MAWLRTFLIVGVVGAGILTFGRADWEGRLRRANYTWIIRLERAPVWNAPPAPTYSRFQATFDDLPPSPSSGMTIYTACKWDWTFVRFCLYLWIVAGIMGIAYTIFRSRKRDWLLHGALCVGIGLTAGAGTSFALWLIFGGWGPPCPEVFAMLGLLTGIILAPLTFRLGSN